MKSLITSVMWPIWTWLQWPESRWIFTSYNAKLSTNLNLKRRRIIRSAWFQRRWGNRVKLRDDQDQKTEFENTMTGKFLTTSTGGSVAGEGGNFIVIDDPQNPFEANSLSERNAANAHVSQLITRLNDPKRDRIVMIMQRIHYDDATAEMDELHKKLAKIQEGVAPWPSICLPSEATKKEVLVFPKQTEGANGTRRLRNIIRDPGDLLWPERVGKVELSIIREQLGSYNYAAQYQQSPSPEGGGIVRQSWWQFFREPPTDFKISAWFWDTAIKDKQVNDYTAGVFICETKNGHYYIMQCVKKRLLYPDLKNQIIISANASPPNFIMVEDKASGQQVCQEMNKKNTGQECKFPVLPFMPKGDKVQRLSLVSPLIEAGRVHLPLDAEWTEDFIEEFNQFPQGAHDDQVDACVMGLTHLHLGKRSGKFRDTGGSRSSLPMAGSLRGSSYGSD